MRKGKRVQRSRVEEKLSTPPSVDRVGKGIFGITPKPNLGAFQEVAPQDGV
jgi:hypothetical protein